MYSADLTREFLNIAYSWMNLAPINTVEHYRRAAYLGYNALKGDVQPTKDNGLVMCHDKGFTLNSEGRIVRYDRQEHILIRDMTQDEVLRLTHEAYADTVGYHAHTCTFDDFVRVCREEDRICYPVIRDERMDVVLPELFKTLDRYGYREKTMINSMTYSSAQAARAYDPDIALCYTLNHGEVMTREHVDMVLELGNAMLDGFLCPGDNWRGLLEESRDAIEYAKEKGVPLMMAQVFTAEQYTTCREWGFTGFHIVLPILDKV